MSAPPLAALIFSVLELENAMKHLRRSNEELREALAETPDDQDFIDAIAVSARQRRLDTPLRWLAPAVALRHAARAAAATSPGVDAFPPLPNRRRMW